MPFDVGGRETLSPPRRTYSKASSLKPFPSSSYPPSRFAFRWRVSRMEAAVENVTLLLRKAGRSQNKNTAENAAAEVASAACSQLGALWAASVDTGRVAAAAAHKAYHLLLCKRDMEQFLLGSACTDTNGRPFASAVQRVCTLSDTAFTSVRVCFSGARLSNGMCPRRPTCGSVLAAAAIGVVPFRKRSVVQQGRPFP